jgi:hypothetical protein
MEPYDPDAEVWFQHWHDYITAENRRGWVVVPELWSQQREPGPWSVHDS